jgi:hypothetical protein
LSLTTPRRIDLIFVALAGLSGIGAALTAPLFLRSWRAGRAPDPRGILLVGIALAHGYTAVTSGRTAISIDPVPIFVGSIVIALFALIPGARTPVVTRATFGYVAVVTLVLGAAAMGPSSRYLLAASAAVTLAVATFVIDRRPTILAAGAGAGALLMALMIVAYPITKAPDSDWAEQARCIGGTAPCRVAVYPVAWSVDWSGDPGTFHAPRGMDRRGMPLQ